MNKLNKAVDAINKAVKDTYHLTPISKNKKTGAMAVSTLNESTCPDICPLKNRGCMADNFHLKMHWEHVSTGERGVSWDTFTGQIRKLPAGSKYRNGQAGDHPKDQTRTGDYLDSVRLKQLVHATRKLKSFGYTHFPIVAGTHRYQVKGMTIKTDCKPNQAEHNLELVKYANSNGYTLNASANSIHEVDALMATGTPTVTLMADNSKKVSYTEQGNKVVMCPAQTSERVTCTSCMLCAKPDRKYAIGFYPHGIKAKLALEIAQ
jgi:hypothetical protein